MPGKQLCAAVRVRAHNVLGRTEKKYDSPGNSNPPEIQIKLPISYVDAGMFSYPRFSRSAALAAIGTTLRDDDALHSISVSCPREYKQLSRVSKQPLARQ